MSADAESTAEETPADIEGQEAPEQAEVDEEASPTEEDAPPAEETKRADKSFLAYRRKVEKLRRDREALAADRDALERARGDYEEAKQLAEKFKRLDELSKVDALEALGELGIDYDTLTKLAIEGAGQDEGTRKLKRELAEMKRKAELAEKESEERKRRDGIQAKRAELSTQLATIAKDEDAYPYASELSPRALIAKVDKIHDEMVEAGIDMRDVTLDDFVFAVEKRQAAKAGRWRKTFERLEKRTAPKATAPTTTAHRTLSSRDAGDATKRPDKPLTREEKRARLIAMIPD